MKNKILLTLILCSFSYTVFAMSEPNIVNMYASLVDQWKEDVKTAFNDAEKEIFDIDPPLVPIGPDEDPAKCPCKGTGTIVHGDGHKTPCPFHSSEFSSNNCNCEDCKCNLTETE